MNQRPLKNTLICFSKLCDDRNEKAYFRGNETSKIEKFFQEEQKKYPDVLKNNIRQEWDYLTTFGWVVSWGPDFNPCEVPRGMQSFYNNVENRETFNKIALNFYNEFSCDYSGRKRENLDNL